MKSLDLQSFKNKGNAVVQHAGIVSKITDKVITVALEGNVHCEACNVKAACGVSESNTKEIEIPNGNISFQILENVTVLMQKQLGLKAVFWAYVFPFILMFGVLLLASNFFSEWIAGLASILILVPYYIALYLKIHFFKNAFKISIVKNN